VEEARQKRDAGEHADHAQDPAGEDGDAVARGRGNEAGASVADQRTGHVTDHLHAGEAAAQVIGDGLIPNRHPEYGADGVCRAGKRQTRDRER
jgi:hypothetical protein